MTTPKELDNLIHDLQNGNPISPQNADEHLVKELFELANQFELNPDFDTSLSDHFKQPASKHRPFKLSALRWVATFMIGIFGIVLLVTNVPALRVLAEDLINELFPRDTDTERVIAREDDRLIFESEDFMGFTTIEEVIAGVEFEVKFPDLSETDYVFEHGSLTIPRNSLQLNYSDGSSSNSLNLRIKQQPLADSIEGSFYLSAEQDTISPEVETTPVSIGRYHGEVVKGAWVTSRQRDETVHYLWSNHFPIYRLRWQDDVYLYEIKLVTAEDKSAIDDMITLAESMMD